MALRLFDEPAAAPARNMALDEALLLDGTGASLRLYGWRPHAVSIGYFQRHADFADVAAAMPLVRRLTGGGAICHGAEITFALCADAGQLPALLDDGYAVVHDAVLEALGAVGVRAVRLRAGDGPSARPADRWCFAAPGRHDLVDDSGRKLCGSAQRRVRTARGPRVLHHGSLVMERPPLTPFVAAVGDAVDARAAAPALRAALATAFGRALGLRPTPATPEVRELQEAARLQRERYESPAFVCVR